MDLPRFTAEIAALLLAPSLSARAAARTCTEHAYEQMDVRGVRCIARGEGPRGRRRRGRARAPAHEAVAPVDLLDSSSRGGLNDWNER
jgi:hypothetical protein